VPVPVPVLVPALAAFAALAIVACSDSAPRTPPATTAGEPPAKVEAQPAPPPAAPRRQPPSLAGCSARDRDGHPIGNEGYVTNDQYLELRAGDDCEITDYELVAKLHGPVRALALPHGQVAVLLREGTLEVDLAPGSQANADRGSGFRFATPGGQVEMVQGARVVARAFASGSSLLYVVSGQLRVQPAGRGERAVELAAGHGLSLSNVGAAQPLDIRLGRVEETLAWIAKARGQSGRVGPAVASLAALANETWSEGQPGLARLEELGREHDRLVASGAPGAMELQREIATLSGTQFARGRIMEAQAAALEAWTLDPEVPGREAALEVLGRVHAEP
jgi:hypothetical protein